MGRPGWERLLPGVAALRSYDRAWLPGDAVAGVTVAAYLVPQVMAYAAIAGLAPVVGLWATLPALLVYVIFGSSRQLSVGPESTTALMTAAGVGALMAAGGGTVRHAEVAALLAIAVGIVSLAAWLGRLGFLSRLLSRPVLVGYMIGVAVLMIVSQLGTVTKLTLEGGSSPRKVWSALVQLPQAHAPTVVLSAVTLVLLLAGRRLAPRAPGPLIVLLGAAAAVGWLGLERHGIEVIGHVPLGLPAFRLPALGDVSLWALLPFAAGIAVVGYSDNVLTGRVFAAHREQEIDAGQELLALGVANVATGLFQGFPVSSSGSRTVIGDAVGSRTQLHSLVAVACVVATLLFAGPVLQSFPTAALGALVIYAATRLIDVAELRRVARFRHSELVLALSTAAAVLFFDVLIGVGIAIALSLLDLIRRISHPHDGVLGHVPGVPGMHDIDDYPTATQVPGLVVYRYDSPLFFANADDFLVRAKKAVTDAERPVRWFLLNAEANVEIDLTAVDMLDQLRLWLHDRGIRFALARVKQDLRDQLGAAGFLDRLGDDCLYATLPTAVDAYERWRDTHPEPKAVQDGSS